MELFAGGISAAMNDFDKSFKFAFDYPFCSLGEVYGSRNLGIVSRDCFKDKFAGLNDYKQFCRDAIIIRNMRKSLGGLTIE
jgi:hypothetical protein